MAARWYTPANADFASRDNWTLDPDPAIQANRYTYANSDPLDSADPTGHYAGSGSGTLVVGGVIAGGVVGGAAVEYGGFLALGVAAFAGGYYIGSYGYRHYGGYTKTSVFVNFGPSGFGVTHGCLCGRGVNPSSGGRPNSGGGNDGGSVWLPPPPPTLAEIQHALEQAEITKPVPRPTTKPGVDQKQLDKQRDKVEKNVKSATGNDDSSDIISEIGHAFTPTTDRVAYSPVTGGAGAGGGKGGGGPPAQPPATDDDGEDDPEGPHLALGHNVGPVQVEVGGKTIEINNEFMLEDFAKEIGAITYRDEMFQDLWSLPKETLGPQVIDRVVQANGRISFNLENVNADAMLDGTDDGYTAYELRHICGNPAIRAITAFVNGAAPC